MTEASQVSETKPIWKQNLLSRKEEQGGAGVGLLDWMSFKNPFQLNIFYNSVKLNPNPSLMMSRSWTCLPGTYLPQGWGLTSCHLQLINSLKHPHAYSCSCDRQCCLLLFRNSCLQQVWLKYFGEFGLVEGLQKPCMDMLFNFCLHIAASNSICHPLGCLNARVQGNMERLRFPPVSKFSYYKYLGGV